MVIKSSALPEDVGALLAFGQDYKSDHAFGLDLWSAGHKLFCYTEEAFSKMGRQEVTSYNILYAYAPPNAV
jgi:hypothetical protein